MKNGEVRRDPYTWTVDGEVPREGLVSTLPDFTSARLITIRGSISVEPYKESSRTNPVRRTPGTPTDPNRVIQTTEDLGTHNLTL